MKRHLCLDKCGDDWDWYALRWDNYDRVNGASIEGDAAEWLSIADSIGHGESVSFKRVAFDKQPDGSWLVSSPRNSTRATVLTAEDVAELPAVIRAAVGGGK